MDVKNVLTLPSFEGAKVLAGGESLTNDVSSIMVLEASDISSWGKPGQMLLTSYYGLKDLNDEELEDFFDQMTEIGISAFVFKTNRLVDSVPNHIIRLCKAHSMPLIHIRNDVKYSDILTEVMEKIIASNIDVLNKFYDLHYQAMRLTMQMPSLQQILYHLKSQIHYDLAFLEDGKRVMASTFSLPRYSPIEIVKYYPANSYQAFLYCDAQFANEEYKKQIIAVKIPTPGRNDYYLLIKTYPETLSPFDMIAIENTVSLLQIEILKEKAIERELFIQKNSQVHALLTNKHLEKTEVDGILSSLHINNGPLYQAILIKVNPTSDESKEDIERIIVEVVKAIKFKHPNTVHFIENNLLIFVHNFTAKERGFNLHEIERIINDIRKARSEYPFQALGILSRDTERYEIARLYDDLLNIYKLFDNRRETDKFISASSLGAYGLFTLVNDLDELAAFIDKRVVEMREKDADIYRTLLCMTENNMNVKMCANELFIHPKTVSYRIKKALNAYDLDIYNTDDMIQIVLSGKIFTLLEQ